MTDNVLTLKTKKGKKQINLSAPLLPGRHYCQCHAQVHNLVNNCLVCGRVVCEQEGAGPCFFCGNEVLLKGQRADFGKNEEEFPEFQDPNSEVNCAIQHKNKMLEFDKSNFIQKNVFDEQTDWYSIADDVWQDQKSRKLAMNQIVARQEEIDENDKYVHVQYDAQQRKWLDSKPVFDDAKFKKQAQEFQGQIEQNDRDGVNQESGNSGESDSDDNAAPRRKNNNNPVKASANKTLKMDQQDVYNQIKEELVLLKKQSSKPSDTKKEPFILPTQSKLAKIVKTDEFEEFQREIKSLMDKEIKNNDKNIIDGKNPYDEQLYNMQLDDEGKCLSMLQPWASLLIEGFKRFEGRYWTIDYKGPLYIHAGATPPTQQQIDEVENQYKEHYKGVKNMPPFPQRYPTGCLIGCVDLQGVLTRDQYISNVPEKFREDSQCDYIFVVRNPRKLFYPVKTKGSKNIFDISNDIRINCRSQLLQVPSTWYEWIAKDLNINEIQGVMEEVPEEAEKQISASEKFEMNYPSLGPPAEQRKKSEEIKSSKYSNSKKDFMQSDEIHSKLRKLASDVKVKLEGFGFMLAPFLSLDEQTDIVNYFNQKSGGICKIGIANLDQFPFDNSFPYMEKILEYATKTYCYFTEGKKSDCLNQIKIVEYFYLNKKQKRFSFKQEYFLILVLGCDYEIVVQNNQTYKTKQVSVGNATILMQLYDEHTSIIYESHNPNTKNQLKDIGLKDTLTNLVICFKQK